MRSNEKTPLALLQAFAARTRPVTDMAFTPGYSLTFVSPSGTELRVSLQVKGTAIRQVVEKPVMGPRLKRWKRPGLQKSIRT